MRCKRWEPSAVRRLSPLIMAAFLVTGVVACGGRMVAWSSVCETPVFTPVLATRENRGESLEQMAEVVLREIGMTKDSRGFVYGADELRVTPERASETSIRLTACYKKRGAWEGDRFSDAVQRVVARKRTESSDWSAIEVVEDVLNQD